MSEIRNDRTATVAAVSKQQNGRLRWGLFLKILLDEMEAPWFNCSANSGSRKRSEQCKPINYIRSETITEFNTLDIKNLFLPVKDRSSTKRNIS